MAKYIKGTDKKVTALSFEAPAPLDDRSVITNVFSLISLETWTDLSYLYVGLQTVVLSTQEVYICLINGYAPTTEQEAVFQATKGIPTRTVSDADALSIWGSAIDLCWKKLPSMDDLGSGTSSLSGVFTFKGLAHAVSPDLTYVLKTDPSKSNVTPIGVCTDLEGDQWYGWTVHVSESETYDVWTEEGTINDMSTQYERVDSSQQIVRSIMFNDVLYMPSSASLPGGGFLVESIGGYNYVVDKDITTLPTGQIVNIYPYNGFDASYKIGDEVGNSPVLEWTGYSFDEYETPLTIENEMEIIVAAPGNEGHVYQIEEEEYASNGKVWVNLGSPADTWIVL